MKQKFYICKKCGKITTNLKDSPVPTMCCGEVMQELIAGSVEASTEKHIPVYNVENNIVTVNIGEVEHPMTPEHYIEWVLLQTNAGSQIKYLQPNTKPEVSFSILDTETIESVYAYCNLHSLWKK